MTSFLKIYFTFLITIFQFAGLHGTNDVTTATLHVLLGDQREVDVTSVCSGGKFQTFSLAMVSYGYFGDLLRRSEKYRWMGPKRYDISGVRTFLGEYLNYFEYYVLRSCHYHASKFIICAKIWRYYLQAEPKNFVKLNLTSFFPVQYRQKKLAKYTGRFWHNPILKDLLVKKNYLTITCCAYNRHHRFPSLFWSS